MMPVIWYFLSCIHRRASPFVCSAGCRLTAFCISYCLMRLLIEGWKQELDNISLSRDLVKFRLLFYQFITKALSAGDFLYCI